MLNNPIPMPFEFASLEVPHVSKRFVKFLNIFGEIPDPVSFTLILINYLFKWSKMLLNFIVTLPLLVNFKALTKRLKHVYIKRLESLNNYIEELCNLFFITKLIPFSSYMYFIKSPNY